MTYPLLAPADQANISNLEENLPQSLIIEAEPGLDSALLVEKLIKSESSDRFTIKPEDDKKHIGVQQVRELIYNLRTFASRRRVVVISPAEQMNEESQNALLKILEEPTEKLHFILVVSNRALLLETIVSRCQLLTLHRTSPLQDNSLLKNSDLDDHAKQQIRFLASGRPALIRQIVAQPELLNQYREIASNAKIIMKGVSYDSLVASQKYSSSREDALQLIDVLLTLIRFQIKSQGLSPDIERLLQKTHRAEESLKSNGNIKLALLQIMVQ